MMEPAQGKWYELTADASEAETVVGIRRVHRFSQAGIYHKILEAGTLILPARHEAWFVAAVGSRRSRDELNSGDAKSMRLSAPVRSYDLLCFLPRCDPKTDTRHLQSFPSVTKRPLIFYDELNLPSLFWRVLATAALRLHKDRGEG